MLTQILLTILLQTSPTEAPTPTSLEQINVAFTLAVETKSRPSILCLEPKFRKANELTRELASPALAEERKLQIDLDLASLVRSAGKCPMPSVQAKN